MQRNRDACKSLPFTHLHFTAPRLHVGRVHRKEADNPIERFHKRVISV